MEMRGGKIFVFVDNSDIPVSMLNHSGLHLNERGTTRLVNNLALLRLNEGI